MTRAGMIVILAASGCVRAGFENPGASASDGAVPPPGRDLKLERGSEARADLGAAPPVTSGSGGSQDPTWKGVAFSATGVVAGAVQLEEQPGFALKQPTLPSPRAWGTAAAVKGQIFVFGGGTQPSSFQSTAEILGYQPATDTLKPVGKLPAALLGSEAVAAPDGMIYVMMGIDPTISNEIESRALRFDPLSGGVTIAGTGLYAAYHHGSALGANGLIYSFAGYGSGPLHNTIEGFDPKTGKVVPVAANLASFAEREKLTAVAAPNGKIYLFGGALSHDEASQLGGKLTDQIFRFDPSVPSIQLLGTRLPAPMMNLAGGLLPDGQIVLVGADSAPMGAPVPIAIVLRFDPTTETLVKTGDTLPGPLSGAAAAVGENGKLYLFGGYTSVGLSQKILELHPYATAGSATGPVIDTGSTGTRWLALEWKATNPPGTTLTVRARASDAKFAPTDPAPAWQLVPSATGLPAGRYLQWDVQLKSVNTALTPSLVEIAVRYQPR